MRAGYSVKRIKDICDKGSSNVAQKDLEGHDGDYPIFGASGFIKKVNFFHQDREYVGIVKDGSGIGRVSFYPPKSSLIGTLQYIFPKKEYDIRYVGYCLQSLDLASYRQGAAIPHIYFRDYGEREVLVADSITEQQRIVVTLDQAFAKIDALKATAEKSLQESFDLFQSLLKVTLTPSTDWIHCELKDVCSFFNGKPHEGDVDENGKYVLVNSKFIASNMSIRKMVKKPLFPLFEGDIVMVMSDVPNGKALAKCQIIDLDNTYTLNQRICAFRDAKIRVRFLYYLINRNPYLLAFNNGENQTNLRKNDIITMPIAYPSDEREIDAITKRLDDFSDKCQTLQENYQKTLALCDDMKQALLRKAFNGEL